MDMNELVSGNNLSAADLKGRDVALIIEGVEIIDFDEGTKARITFRGTDKGFILNKVNTRAIIDQLGSESNDWIGKRIVIFPTQTEFGNKIVPCIRVKLPEVQVGPDLNEPPQQLAGTPTNREPGEDDTNAVPF